MVRSIIVAMAIMAMIFSALAYVFRMGVLEKISFSEAGLVFYLIVLIAGLVFYLIGLAGLVGLARIVWDCLGD